MGGLIWLSGVSTPQSSRLVTSWISAEGLGPHPLGMAELSQQPEAAAGDADQICFLHTHPQLIFFFTSKELKFISCVKVKI